MKIPFYIVDVFAEKKYAGNQLAVFLDAENLSDDKMQTIAREINFAESTFITKLSPENNAAEIRIFTPEYEMKFAGHPIIGTSWVLMNKIFENQPQNIVLTVPIGEIPVNQSGDLVWLQAAQPEFLDTFLAEDFLIYSHNCVNLDLSSMLRIYFSKSVFNSYVLIIVLFYDKNR